LRRTDVDGEEPGLVLVELSVMEQQYQAVMEVLQHGATVTLRVEGNLIHVLADGVLIKTMPSPFTPERRVTLAGCRPAGPPPSVCGQPIRVQRTVSQTGAIRVAKRHVCVGFHHAREVVTVDAYETERHGRRRPAHQGRPPHHPGGADPLQGMTGRRPSRRHAGPTRPLLWIA
jgi:hypothetical protein